MNVSQLKWTAMRLNRRQRTGLTPLLLGMAISVLPSCGGGEELVRPTEGTILINTTTTGSDIDPDGYSVTVDDNPEQAVGTSDELEVTNLDPGEHNVALTGVIQNCTVGGAGRRAVNVIAGETVNVTFRITCEAIVPPQPPGGGPLP